MKGRTLVDEQNEVCRTGILTFHDADNQGAVLQAYALQSALRRIPDVLPEIIHYRCEAVEATKKITVKCLRDAMKAIPMMVYYAIKHRGFQTFRKKYLELSSSRYSRATIGRAAEAYDVYITGSDQVWNLGCSGNDSTYFLDFVSEKKRRSSYAASMGNCQYGPQERQTIADELKKFDYISVREGSSIGKLEQMGISGAQVHLDPVFLLNRQEWLPVMSRRLLREKYVFVYLIQEDVNVFAAARDYAQKHGCKIISNKTSLKYILNGSPSDFLSWIYYAEAVFTNSFHGTAFSVLFGKKLGADVELRSGGVNNRICELLQTVHGEACMFCDDNWNVSDEFDEALLTKQIHTAEGYLRLICTR